MVSAFEEWGETQGEILRAMNPVEGAEIMVEVVSTHFVDPKGNVFVHDLIPLTPLGGDSAQIKEIDGVIISEMPEFAYASLAMRLGKKLIQACSQKGYWDVASKTR